MRDQLLTDLERRLAASAAGGGAERVDRQHKDGKLTARERVDLLLDAGSFVEIDALVTHRCRDFGMEDQKIPGDGVVCGYGTIDGRLIYLFAQDFTVFGGSLSETNAAKICKVMDLAVENGAPVIGLNDSGGARIQEGVVSLGGYADIFLRNTLASGVVPQISAIMGPCAGGAVYSPAITDFILMVEGTSYMFVTGPDVIRTVTHEEVTKEDLGGAATHAGKSGVAHFTYGNDAACLMGIRELLSFLPSNNIDDPPAGRSDDDPDRESELLAKLIPDDPNKPYDVHRLIGEVVDDGKFLEVHAAYARNLVVGFARLANQSVGIVANQPNYLAGRARHRRLLEGRPVRALLRRFQHPPGHVRGCPRVPARHPAGVWRDHQARRQAPLRLRRGDRPQAHRDHTQGLRRRLLRHGLEAPPDGRQSRLPLGRDRGHGSRGRGQRPLQARAREGGLVAAEARAEKVALYREKFSNPYIAAERGFVDAVIEPRKTRPALIRALRQLRSKRQSLPPKKHGNLPL